jgi:chromosome segregation ATPase
MQNDINNLIPAGVEEQLDRVNTKLETTVTTVISLAKESQKIRFGAADDVVTLEKAAEATKKTAAARSELQISMGEYKKLVDQVATLQAKLNALESENAKQVATSKQALQQRNAELKREAELQAAANGSIEQARAIVKNLTAERNKLNLTTEQGRARQKALNDEIDRQNEFIKANVDQYTRQKINIGNYSGALQILEKELTTIRQKMDDYNKSGNQNSQVLEQLTKEEALLTTLVENQVNGFASATMELRNNEKALQALEAAGLRGSEMFNQLLTETGELKDHVRDLKSEIKNLGIRH